MKPNLLAAMLLSLPLVQACGDSNKAPKKPAVKQAAVADPNPETGKPAPEPYEPAPAATPTGMTIAPTSQTGTIFRFAQGQVASIRFEVSGAESRTIQVAILDAPSTVRISGATTMNPTITWDRPYSGTHDLQLVVRDLTACQAAEQDSSSCQPDSNGRVARAETYDQSSDQYTITVDENSNGGLGNSGLGGLTSNPIVSQILAVVPGLLGGGTGASTILQSLGSNQLQNIFQTINSGGQPNWSNYGVNPNNNGTYNNGTYSNNTYGNGTYTNTNNQGTYNYRP